LARLHFSSPSKLNLRSQPGYLASQSASGTKTDTPLLETPQSISVVTKDQIAAQGAQTIVEALRYTPGVTLDTFGATTFFDSGKLRGFDAPRYLDGLRLPIDPGTQFPIRASSRTVWSGWKC
jgi:iron complex outermembrane receptor protein